MGALGLSGDWVAVANASGGPWPMGLLCELNFFQIQSSWDPIWNGLANGFGSQGRHKRLDLEKTLEVEQG